MSKNKADNSAVGLIKNSLVEQQRHHKSYHKGRHRLVVLTNQVTLLSVTSQSDMSWTDLDITSFT